MNGLEAFGLILLDVMMPGTDGFTLCRELRKNVGLSHPFSDSPKTMEKKILCTVWGSAVMITSQSPLATGS